MLSETVQNSICIPVEVHNTKIRNSLNTSVLANLYFATVNTVFLQEKKKKVTSFL